MQLFRDISLSARKKIKQNRDENKNRGTIYMKKIERKTRAISLLFISYNWNVM